MGPEERLKLLTGKKCGGNRKNRTGLRNVTRQKYKIFEQQMRGEKKVKVSNSGNKGGCDINSPQLSTVWENTENGTFTHFIFIIFL